MKDLAEAALNAAQVKGASYADVRLDERVQQDVTVKNGQLAAVSDDASEGLGVRVLGFGRQRPAKYERSPGSRRPCDPDRPSQRPRPVGAC